jgi:glycosyltransferase involved in cell wall biosynthesis
VAYELLETRRTAGDAALYAPAGDPQAFAGLVAELAADGERRAQLARRARERAQQLVWERSEEELVAVYEQLRPAI